MIDIHFRAWDKENEVMHFSNENEDGIVWEITPQIQFLELRTVDSFPGGEYHEQTEEWVRPDQVIMQYTGLKDKNGQKIYVGDIVKLYSWPWSKHGKGVAVEWSEQTGFAPFNEFCENPEILGYPSAGQWCEVIGTIYQNPKLLK